MFNIGMSELIVILAVALIALGPEKLPDVARKLAKALREFRRASDDLKSTFQLDGLDEERPQRFEPRRSVVDASPSTGAVGTSHDDDTRTLEGASGIHASPLAAPVEAPSPPTSSPPTSSPPTDAGPRVGVVPQAAAGTFARGTSFDDDEPAGSATAGAPTSSSTTGQG